MIKADDLIDILYSAATDPDGWSEAVRVTAAFLEADAGLAYLPGLSPTNFARDYVGWNVLTYEQTAGIAVTTGRLDAFIETGRARGLVKPGYIGLGQDCCTTRIWDENPWSELAYETADIRHYMGFIGRMPSAGLPSMHFSLFRRPTGTPFSHDDLERLNSLRPHLERAARMIFALRLERERGEFHRSTANAISTSVVIVDAGKRIVYANAAAEDMLRSAQYLSMRQGKIIASNAADEDALSRLVKNGLHAGADSQIIGTHGAPAAVSVTPASLPSGHRGVMLFLSLPSTPVGLQERVIRLYGVTTSEAEVALRLGEGAAPALIAEERGVKIETVRAQLRSIFAKIGVAGQVQLVKQLERLARIR